MRRILITALVAWLVASPPTQAQEKLIDAKLPSGEAITAAFQSGKPGRPAVLVLHGFLQTREFPTVANLGQALASAGYAVLAPTLSLGVSKRKRSLPCEAVHTHTLDGDVAELAFWVQWLNMRGYKHIVLVGHSFGSLQILSYLGRKHSPTIGKALLISLTDVEVKQAATERAQIARGLRERVARGDRSLVEAEFGQCRKYVSPPAALLSYATITRSTILDELSKSTVPVEAILGSDDDRMGRDWPDRLRARGIAVRMVPGANHFFDNQYEFDLHDAVLQGLTSDKAGR